MSFFDKIIICQLNDRKFVKRKKKKNEIIIPSTVDFEFQSITTISVKRQCIVQNYTNSR